MAKENEKSKEKIIETWKPITLGCMFIFSALSDIYYGLVNGNSQSFITLGNGQPIDNIVFLLFGFVFFGISWGFFKRKSWAFKWGMWTGGINVIYNIYLGTYTWILYWGFALWLVYTSKEELVNS